MEARLRMPDAPIVFDAQGVGADLALEDGSRPHGLPEVLERMAAAERTGRSAAVTTLEDARTELGMDGQSSSWLWRSTKALAGLVAAQIWSAQRQERKYVSLAALKERTLQVLRVALKGS